MVTNPDPAHTARRVCLIFVGENASDYAMAATSLVAAMLAFVDPIPGCCLSGFIEGLDGRGD
jgi:hypothetical protein